MSMTIVFTLVLLGISFGFLLVFIGLYISMSGGKSDPPDWYDHKDQDSYGTYRQQGFVHPRYGLTQRRRHK